MEQSADISNGQLPLRGVVLCCTSLLQDVRNKLAEVAAEMGAVHKLDLTADVTHLLVGNITTPKYRYVAKDRPDIKVLTPGWVEAVRESWMEGGDVDVQALEKEYHLRPFTGLEICVTGFEDLEQRNYISDTVKAQGANYHGDLTRQVTHLIAATANGAKYQAAKQWNTKIVSLKWFAESLQRGMALDESLYDPLVPEDQQGKGAFRHQVKPRTTLGKRGREDESQNAGDNDLSRKQLRRSVSTRLESQSQEMLQGMSRQSVTAEPSYANQWKDEDENSTPRQGMELTKQVKAERVDTRSRPSETTKEVDQSSRGLLSGIHVFVHGFDMAKTASVLRVLEQNGAHIANSPRALEDAPVQLRYLVVPHECSEASARLSNVPANTITATEWWVERCIHTKRFINPEHDVLARPLGNPNVLDHCISTTGFAGVDLRQISEAVKLMGAKYHEVISPSTTVLISGSDTIKQQKAYYAQKHRIPIVSAEWLWALLETGLEPALEKYEMDLPAFVPKNVVSESSTSSPAASDILRLSANESITSKGDPPPKRLSNTRRSHATPSLSLQSAKPSPSTRLLKPQPIVHEDNDDSFVVDQEPVPLHKSDAVPSRGSQPLQEVSPNLSPRKANAPARADNNVTQTKCKSQPRPRSRTASPAKPTSPPKSPESLPKPTTSTKSQPPARPRQELAADLAEILDRQIASRPSSAADSQPQKRKKRPLGRAPSGISNRSASLSTHSENTSAALNSDDVAKSAADGFVFSNEVPLPPSTQLGYETPEAEAHRQQMSKKMGTKLHDEDAARRVPSVGTVKDSSLSADAGVSNRVRGKQRSK